MVSTQYSFDRTEFGVTYSSGKFFQGLGDKAIDDMIVFNTNIIARILAE